MIFVKNIVPLTKIAKVTYNLVKKESDVAKHFYPKLTLIKKFIYVLRNGLPRQNCKFSTSVCHDDYPSLSIHLHVENVLTRLCFPKPNHIFSRFFQLFSPLLLKQNVEVFTEELVPISLLQLFLDLIPQVTDLEQA